MRCFAFVSFGIFFMNLGLTWQIHFEFSHKHYVKQWVRITLWLSSCHYPLLSILGTDLYSPGFMLEPLVKLSQHPWHTHPDKVDWELLDVVGDFIAPSDILTDGVMVTPGFYWVLLWKCEANWFHSTTWENLGGKRALRILAKLALRSPALCDPLCHQITLAWQTHVLPPARQKIYSEELVKRFDISIEGKQKSHLEASNMSFIQVGSRILNIIKLIDQMSAREFPRNFRSIGLISNSGGKAHCTKTHF